MRTPVVVVVGSERHICPSVWSLTLWPLWTTCVPVARGHGFSHPRSLRCFRLMATVPSPCLSDLSVLTLPPLLAQGVALFLVVPYICPCFINSSLH